jgi:hypothetical protein
MATCDEQAASQGLGNHAKISFISLSDSGILKAMGLGAADYWRLRKEMVKLRANLSEAFRAMP